MSHEFMTYAIVGTRDLIFRNYKPRRFKPILTTQYLESPAKDSGVLNHDQILILSSRV